jgi:hypothetical protein
MSIIDFDSDGAWDAEQHGGPAIHAPDDVKAIVVTEYRIEWLDMSEPSINFYPKNHMVGFAIFPTSQWFGSVEYKSARISMEVDVEVAADDEVPGVIPYPTFKCGQDYGPGIFTVALQKYNTATSRAPHHRTYPVAAGTTIGDLIKPIIDKQMHHFLFLAYTDEDRFKGCGHFILSSWVLYLNLGLITSENSVEDPNMTLSEELTNTYIKDENDVVKSTFARVGKGRFLFYDEGEPDKHAPEEIWSRATPKHQVVLAKAGDTDEDDAANVGTTA